jgi:hypothetical protein
MAAKVGLTPSLGVIRALASDLVREHAESIRMVADAFAEAERGGDRRAGRSLNDDQEPSTTAVGYLR